MTDFSRPSAAIKPLRTVRCLITGAGPFFQTLNNPSSLASIHLHDLLLTCPPVREAAGPYSLTAAGDERGEDEHADFQVKVTFIQTPCSYKVTDVMISALHEIGVFDCMLHVGLKVEIEMPILETKSFRLGYRNFTPDNFGHVAPQVEGGYGLEGDVDEWRPSIDVKECVRYMREELGFTETSWSANAGDYLCGYTYALSMKCAESMAVKANATALKENGWNSKLVLPIPVVFCHMPHLKPLPGEEPACPEPHGPYTELEMAEYLKGVVWCLGREVASRW